MTKAEKAKIYNALRKTRLNDLKERRNEHRAANRLRQRLNRNMAKQHAAIGRAAAEVLGIDMVSLRKEHQKADVLIKRQLNADRKRMKQSASEVRRDHRRKLAQGLRSAAAFHAAHQGTNPTSLWRADTDDRTRTGDEADVEQIRFDYGSSDGRNDVKFRLRSESSDPYGAKEGTYVYLLNFYYEREESGVVRVGSWVGSNGFLTARSSLAEVCCGGFQPASVATIQVSATMWATTVDANGNPQHWAPLVQELGRAGAAGQDFGEERIRDERGLDYSALLPVVGGVPVLISVGVEVWFGILGIGEVEAEFYSPPSFETEFPFVVVSSI